MQPLVYGALTCRAVVGRRQLELQKEGTFHQKEGAIHEFLRSVDLSLCPFLYCRLQRRYRVPSVHSR